MVDKILSIGLLSIFAMVALSTSNHVDAKDFRDMAGAIEDTLGKGGDGLSVGFRVVILLVGFVLAGSGLWQMIEARKNNNTFGGSLFMFFGGCLLIAYTVWATIFASSFGMTIESGGYLDGY